jgi:23S rRNA (uracil1939-C5)-methyltransferase
MTLTLTDNGIDMSLKSKKNPSLSDIENLAALVNSNKAIKIEWNDEPIAQILKPSIKIGDYYVEFPSGSFLQPSKEGQDVLTSLVCNFISGYNFVADLFCGLELSRYHYQLITKKCMDLKVFSPAVNALNHSGCQKVSGEIKDLFKDCLTSSELDKYEAIVLDPPRLGAYNQVKELSKTSKVKKVAYVSCNPATFSRDAEVLINGGFVLKQISPVDQFIYSHHLELVALFQKA